MRASLRALLEGLIDYAGLFPPAKLPMAEAVANYRRYREGPDAWMLGRFVCPAARLKEIPETTRLRCAALLRGAGEGFSLLEGVERDLADIATSQQQVEVLEGKLPESLLSDLATTTDLLDRVTERLRPASLHLFLEAPVSSFTPMSQIVGYLSRKRQAGCSAGFKLRAGGLEGSAFPTTAQVAWTIRYCAGAEVPLKATAGLHHPLPRFDAAIGARMHGFVNLFVAGVLANARGLSVDQIHSILDDADPASFTFADDGLSWRDVMATTEEVRKARRSAVLSFGSCSFDEPRDDLRALGWM